MNDNVLIQTQEPVPAPASLPVTGNPREGVKLFPLDWETTTVKLKEGRFTHKLRRPTADEIYERDAELQREIPIARDGSFTTPDPTLNEDVDAKWYDKLIIEATGYKGEVPVAHKAAAFQGIYVREIYIDEDTDVFDDEVPVLEEFGTGDEPDFTVVHVMRQPAESELKRYRRRSSQGEVKPGKRGKQRFISRSTLRNAVEHYDQWCVGVQGAFLEADPHADTPALKHAVDPLIKRQVVEALVSEISGNLLD